MMTLTSCGGFFPIEMASMRMVNSAWALKYTPRIRRALAPV
jgi:hypothetical protein